MSRLDEPVIFATGNAHKYREVSGLLSEYGIPIEQEDIKRLEIQSDSLEEIAVTSVKNAVCLHGGPVLVEDSGLFINSLDGFPGPYSSYVYRTIGNIGILQVMREAGSRDASFKSIFAYLNPGNEPFLFSGVVSGRISASLLGSRGFGFDPIFVPNEGDGRTFGEMTMQEKNRLSHRSKAVRKFALWYLSNR
jgi:XTP/dITP diphosphohydrolase